MLSLRRFVASTFAASLTLALTGCGMGTPAPPGQIPMNAITGIAYGGGIPIYKGRVRLWQTTTTAGGATYGSAATEITSAQTILTDYYGNFSIANTGGNAYTCTPGQFAYITVTGGDAGGGTQLGGSYTLNPNSVQMAAIGACTALGGTSGNNATTQGNTRVYISELSTVAAAYALGNFIGQASGHTTDGQQLIYVNAPATNNDVTDGAGTCTVTSGVTTSCLGYGLGHAFANAANLVNAVSFGGTLPSGAANSTLDGTTSTGSNSQASVPQALLNTLANIDEACVNTNGGTATNGTTNDGSACGILFSNTTLPGTTTPPTDTLMAMVNLAKSPLGYRTSPSSVTALFNLISKNPGFTPGLTAKPTDYSVAIFYPGMVTGGGTPVTTTYTSVTSIALDANDNVYYDDQIVAGTSGAVGSISANGTGRWTTGSSATYLKVRQVATDTLGYVWTVIYAGGSGAGTMTGLKQADGTSFSSLSSLANTETGIAVDRRNNLWVSRHATDNGGSVVEYLAASSYGAANLSSHNKLTTPDYTDAIAVDQGQNIWGITNGKTTGQAWILPNTANSGSTPTYTTTEYAMNLGATSTAGEGIAIDSSNRGFLNTNQTLQLETATIATGTTAGDVTGISTLSQVAVSGASPVYSEVDGSTIDWYPSGQQNIYGVTATGTTTSVTPCQLPSAATTCALNATAGTFQYPNQLVVDSAGDLWVAYNQNNASAASSTAAAIAEIIGTGAPTWPQLSYGHPGVKP